MKLFKRTGAMILAIVMVLSLIPSTVFAVDETNFVLSATSVDGTTGGTSTVTFAPNVDINLTGIDGLLLKDAVQQGGTGKLQIASMTGKTGLGFTTVEIDTVGNGYLSGAWSDAPKAISAGDPIFTATYTVPAGTEAGLYKVELNFEDPGWLETDGGAGKGGFETNSSYYAYIEVTEPAVVPPFELYYELNSPTDEDTDKYSDFGAGDTVTATIYAKASTPTKLQAFDLYVTNDALLVYDSFESTYGIRVGSSAGDGKASTATLQHIQFEFVEGAKTEIDIDENGTVLATITFKISDDAVFSSDAINNGWMPITITEESNFATENNEKSINTTLAEDDPYRLTVSTPVYGVEIVTEYTVTYDDNVDDDSVTNMPDPISVTKYHNIDLTLSNVEPVRTGYTFMGWTKTAGKEYSSDEDIDFAKSAVFSENADTPLYALWKQNTYTVQWFNMNADEMLLESDENVVHGTAPQYDGAEPTKAPAGAKVYNFVGWNEDANADSGTFVEHLPVVTKDTDYYAIFSESDRYITVHWMSQDGTELSTSSILYDTKPQYQGGFSEPTKAEDNGCTYDFAGWAETAGQAIGTALENLPNVTDEVYYYAAFTPNPKTFTVNLVPNGGTIADGYDVSEYTYGNEITLPDASTITRTGYTFDGWYTSAEFAEGTGPVATITSTDFGNKIYYAKWTENTYNVKYLPGEGTGNEYTDSNIGYEDSYTIKAYDDAALNFTAPAGYVFAGWQASNGKTYNTGSSYTKMSEAAGDTIILTALWSQDVFNITYIFKEDGETVVLEDVTNENPDTYDKNVGLTLTAPSKAGYTFKSWAAFLTTTDWGDTEFTLVDGNNIPAGTEADLIIIGTFTMDSYTITYNANGGDVSPATQKYNITSTDELAVPTRNGYTFAGWKNTGEAVGSWGANKTTNPAGQNLSNDWGNVELTAQWTQEVYTITFTGMSGSDTTATYKIEDNATIASKQSNPVKSYYSFNGWTPNGGGNWGTDMIAAADTSTATVNGKYGNVTLTADWTAIEYTITFYEKPRGTADNTVLKTITFTAESGTIEAPSVPLMNGYAGKWGSYSTDPADGNQSVYPEYTQIDYTITYDANGGTVTPATQTYSVNSKDALAVPTREGYTFNGWKVISESVGSWQKDEIVEPSYKLNLDWGSVTLQAQWTAVSYKITFVTVGDAIPEMTYTSGDTKALPTSTGNGLYTFKQWRLTAADGEHNWGEVKDDSTNTAGATFTTDYTVAGHYGNITLTAEWELSFTYDVQEYKYAYTGWKMLRIDATDLEEGTIYTFDGAPMYYTTDQHYLIDPDNDEGVFYTLVPADCLYDLALNRTGEGKVGTSTDAAAVLYADGQLVGDINGDGKLNIADANIIHQMVERGGGYYSEAQLSVLARLRCDIDTDNTGSNCEYRGSINDTNALINLINQVQ